MVAMPLAGLASTSPTAVLAVAGAFILGVTIACFVCALEY